MIIGIVSVHLRALVDEVKSEEEMDQHWSERGFKNELQG